MNTIAKIFSVGRPALFLCGIFAIVLMASPSAGSAQTSFIGITPENVLTLANIERRAAGLPPLSMNDDLTRAAQSKLSDIFRNDYFAHTAPDGTTPWFWIEQSGYPYVYAGENLAMNFTTVMDQHRAWMNSATHRQNILSDRYDEIGVAVGQGVVNGASTTVVVQLFGAQHFAVAQEPSGDPVTQKSATSVIQMPQKVTEHASAAAPSSVRHSRAVAPVFSEEFLRNFAWLLIVLMTSIAFFVDIALFIRARQQIMAHPQ